MKSFSAWYLLFLLSIIPFLAGAGEYSSARSANNFPNPFELPKLRLKGEALNDALNGERILRVAGGGWGEVDPPATLNGREGTISFKVKPLWDREDESHPLLSMRWKDSKGGYLVISQGWWESVGKHRLYFIFNNEEFVHCSATCILAPREWSEVTVTWRSGPTGFCRLYVNGDRLTGTTFSKVVNFTAQGPMFIGSDQGTSLAKGRNTAMQFAGLMVWDVALNDREVDRFFVSRIGSEVQAREQKANWNRQRLRRDAISNPPRDPSGIIRESRVMFDEDMEWATSRAATDRIITKIKKAGFNVYIPCVWHGSNTLYPTSLAPMAASLSKTSSQVSDPLSYLIEQAHLNGIEVHPWFTVVRRENDAFPHFAERGTPAEAYDVHNPGFRAFIVALMLDLVRRYPVDGVNLDYIRSMGNCSSVSCQSDYLRSTGRNLRTDISAFTTDNEAAKHLSEWNKTAVQRIIANFTKEARRVRPGLIISVDSSLLSDFFLLQGNNAIAWANSGLADVVFHMDYARCPDWQNAFAARRQFQDREKMVMLLSNYDILDHGVVPHDSKLIGDFVRLARNIKAGGVAFYHRPQLSEEQVKALQETVFQENARPMWVNLSRP